MVSLRRRSGHSRPTHAPVRPDRAGCDVGSDEAPREERMPGSTFPGDGVLPDAFEALRLSRVTVGGVTLRVRDGGSGPPLLLLHGYPETHLAWGLVAEIGRASCRVRV